jgi:hypothetical protein
MSLIGTTAGILTALGVLAGAAAAWFTLFLYSRKSLDASGASHSIVSMRNFGSKIKSSKLEGGLTMMRNTAH